MALSPNGPLVGSKTTIRILGTLMMFGMASSAFNSSGLHPLVDCHGGYKARSPIIAEAIARCDAMDIANSNCFYSCLVREAGVLKAGSTREFSHRQFHRIENAQFIDTPEGDAAYDRVTTQLTLCIVQWQNDPFNQFPAPTEYTIPELCVDGGALYRCLVNSVTRCHRNRNYSPPLPGSSPLMPGINYLPPSPVMPN